MNMKKEYRAELRLLARVQKKLHRDYARYERNTLKQIAALQRSIKKGERATDRELARINKRRAILEGRINS